VTILGRYWEQPPAYHHLNVSELWCKSAVELAAMIRDRQVSSREVVQAHLDRIEAVNPVLNAIVPRLPVSPGIEASPP
jgi:Asp-tRNA(Asn)/Glu-tRNA(Gln) amidotransferase A subunit family amidase